MKNRWSFAVGFPRKDRFRRCTFCTRGSVRTACHVNGNGFNNYFYNVSEYTATLGPSRFAGLQLPFHTTPWHRVLGCLALTRNCADSRANSLKLPLRSLQTHTRTHTCAHARVFYQIFISRVCPFVRLLENFTFTWSKLRSFSLHSVTAQVFCSLSTLESPNHDQSAIFRGQSYVYDVFLETLNFPSFREELDFLLRCKFFLCSLQLLANLVVVTWKMLIWKSCLRHC